MARRSPPSGWLRRANSRRPVQTEQSTSIRVDVMLSVDMREETTCGGVCRQWALHELIEGIGDGASGDLTQQGSPAAPQQFASHLLRSYERHLIGRTSAVITVNDEIAAILARRYRPTRAVVVVHRCPDLRSEQHERSTLIREAARIPATSPVLLYHGGLTNGRGIELLFQAIAAQGLEHVHLVLMGQGDKREKLELTARSTPSSGRIHVLDPVPPSDLLRWVSSANVGVIPNPGLTLNDRLSSPNKLFECLAAGTPVVGSDFPTMRRIIIPNASARLGAVCDPASAGAIAVGNSIHCFP